MVDHLIMERGGGKKNKEVEKIFYFIDALIYILLSKLVNELYFTNNNIFFVFETKSFEHTQCAIY